MSPMLINCLGDLDRLAIWCERNKLNLNIVKCKFMSFTSRQNPVVADYQINGVSLEKVNEVKDLGVIFDTKLKFKSHIEACLSKSYKLLGFVMRLSRDLSKRSCLDLL